MHSIFINNELNTVDQFLSEFRCRHFDSSIVEKVDKQDKSITS